MKNLTVETAIGTLSCEVHSDPSYPGLTIYWGGRQIAVFERGGDTPVLRALLWDTDKEDPSTVAPIFPGYGEDQTLSKLAPTSPKAVVVIEGGIVQEVISTVPLDFAVVDYDTDGLDVEEVTEMPQINGDVADCFGYTAHGNVMPERAEEMFNAINA